MAIALSGDLLEVFDGNAVFDHFADHLDFNAKHPDKPKSLVHHLSPIADWAVFSFPKELILMKLSLVLIVFFLLCLPRIVRANNFEQASVMSQCPQGNPEAEEIYQEARRYWLGQDGRKRNSQKAQELFEEAMFMGNSKAPLGIGGLYMWDYKDVYKEESRLEFMLKMYHTGVQMGCAEGHVMLAECYLKGWGVPISEQKTLEELKQSVAKGSPKGMENYGNYLIRKTSRIEEGRELLRKSLALGNGDAGYPLAVSYLGDDDNRMYAALRNGSRLGSIRCLRGLAHYYLHGSYGQQKNKELYDCVTKIKESINWFYPPKPVENFDELCPHPTSLSVTP